MLYLSYGRMLKVQDCAVIIPDSGLCVIDVSLERGHTVGRSGLMQPDSWYLL